MSITGVQSKTGAKHSLITNQERLLSDVMNNILPSSQNLYFLVGFFYFSGFEEIYKNIEDKDLRILVGLDIEKDLKNKVREFEVIDAVNHSRGEIKQKFNKSLIQLFNDTDFFDSELKQEAFRLFLNKIKNGTLEIRKTVEPNHAKLYLFENKEEYSQGGEYPGTLITGSSNLSRSGLKGRHEINVVFRDQHFHEGMDLFNKLWENSVEIANKENIDDFINDVVEKVWIDKIPKPYLLYLRVLLEYFDVKRQADIKLPYEITDNKYINMKYQTDAIAKALYILEQHSGVIIADVVGLGKSIIASAIAYNLRVKTIVIAPPHLIPQWDDYRYDFSFNAKVYSSGKIEDALNENTTEEEKLIIIDEAHKYRNEETGDYANLHKLCQKNKVILLSATPFSNRPQDVFSLIRLFQITTKSTIQTVDNLSYQFRELIREFKRIKESQKQKTKTEEQIKREIEELADRIRDILSPLIIRRSRIDLELIEEYKEDLKYQKISFPKVQDPELLEYDLGKLSHLYEDTLRRIAPEEEEIGYIGARYKPAVYIKNIEKYKKKISEEFDDVNLFKQAQRNLASFMKRLLVRRFESSVDAFRKTLDSMISSSEYIKDWYERLGKVPVYKKGSLPSLEELFDLSGEDTEIDIANINYDEQLKEYIERGLVLIEKKELSVQFIKDLNADIKLLKDIRKEWFEKEFLDPKLDEFKKILRKKLRENPKRKVVVFSEFGDTVNYLADKLEEDFKIFRYTSAHSSINNKKIIRENFDAGIPDSEQRKIYDVLIATDAISEGFNLHRAGIVFNYDIPYNPTRVIQRVGRINRINKKVFDELFIYNFFPTKTGERETRVKQISTLKLTMIHALIGEDTKVLTNDEELRSYFIEKFREEMRAQEEKESWDAKYLNELHRIRSAEPALIESARNLPKRVRIKRTKQKNAKGVIVFGKKGDDYIFKHGLSPDDIFTMNAREAINLFSAEVQEKADRVSDGFEKIYQKVKKELFARKAEVAMDKGKREAIDKVKYFKDNGIGQRDYFVDLLRVIEEFDSLPERYLKQIRQINSSSLSADIKELQNDVPHEYLVDIIKRAESIDEGDESIIFAEELV